MAHSLSDNGELSELFLCQCLCTAMNTDGLHDSMTMLLLIYAESSVLLPWQCPHLPCWREWPIRPEDKPEEASDWLGTSIPLQMLPKQKWRRDREPDMQGDDERETTFLLHRLADDTEVVETYDLQTAASMTAITRIRKNKKWEMISMGCQTFMDLEGFTLHVWIKYVQYVVCVHVCSHGKLCALQSCVHM